MAWGKIEYLMTESKGVSPNVVKYGETTITDAAEWRPPLRKGGRFSESFSESFTNKRPLGCCLYSCVEGSEVRVDWKKIGFDFGGKAEINQGVQLQAARAQKGREQGRTRTYFALPEKVVGPTGGPANDNNNAPFRFATFHTRRRREGGGTRNKTAESGLINADSFYYIHSARAKVA